MGLIVIVCMGFFFSITAIVALAYVFVLYTTFAKTKIRYFDKAIITIISSFITLFLFYILLEFYNKNRDMIALRGYLGLAPKFTESLNIKNNDNSLIYTRHTDYNTGGRGGVNISEKLSLTHDEKQKEVEIFITQNIYTPYMAQTKHIDINSKSKKEKYYINIFIDPEIFSINEFKLIVKLLVNNLERIEEIINHSYSLSSKPRYHILSKIYYLNRKSLKRRFVCQDGEVVHLIENGDMFVFSSNKESLFYTSVGNPESVFARPNKIGKAINKDIILSLPAKVDDIEIINTLYQKQLRLQDTIIADCYDETGNDLFEEFKFLKQTPQYK